MNSEHTTPTAKLSAATDTTGTLSNRRPNRLTEVVKPMFSATNTANTTTITTVTMIRPMQDFSLWQGYIRCEALYTLPSRRAGTQDDPHIPAPHARESCLRYSRSERQNTQAWAPSFTVWHQQF